MSLQRSHLRFLLRTTPHLIDIHVLFCFCFLPKKKVFCTKIYKTSFFFSLQGKPSPPPSVRCPPPPPPPPILVCVLFVVHRFLVFLLPTQSRCVAIHLLIFFFAPKVHSHERDLYLKLNFYFSVLSPPPFFFCVFSKNARSTPHAKRKKNICVRSSD